MQVEVSKIQACFKVLHFLFVMIYCYEIIFFLKPVCERVKKEENFILCIG